jgi:hypothetical protein
MFGSKEFKGDITVTSVTDSLPSQAASPTRVRYASELSTVCALDEAQLHNLTR